MICNIDIVEYINISKIEIVKYSKIGAPMSPITSQINPQIRDLAGYINPIPSQIYLDQKDLAGYSKAITSQIW